MKAPLPANEIARLQALYDLSILDTPQEKNFDDITAIAAMICNVPISVITLVDEERQWFKSSVGLEGTETSRDVAFCAHAILQPEAMMIVGDACKDERFRDNPLVTGDPHIRFYAGAPLVTDEGAALGTLCVVDYEPRALSAEQENALAALARQVMQLFNLRAANAMQQRNAENLQSIINGANVGTWEVNLQSGEAIFNERWAAMLGYSLEALQPLTMATWSSLMHSDDLLNANEILQRHFRGETEYYDNRFRMRHRLGYWVWIQAHGRVSKRTADGSPLMMFGTHVDMTALMESRRALEENEERFRSMLSNLPGAVYRCVNDHQWSMQFLSDEVLSLTGYPAEDFIDNRYRSFTDLMHPDDARMVARIVREAITRKHEFTMEYRIQRADGEWRWLQEVGRGIFDEQQQLKYIDGFMWDITEREAIINVMRANEQKLSTLYNMVPVAIASHRFSDGHLIEANPAFYAMTGYTEAEYQQLDYWDITPRRYEHEEQAQMTQLHNTGRYGPYEKHYIHKQGHWIPVLINGVLVESETGEQHTWSIIQDITERKRIEQMKNEFVSVVSHELRTPLTSISAALKLVVGGALGEVPEKSRTMLDIAYKNSQRLALLINDLLDMEKLLAGKMTFNVNVQPLQPLLAQAVYENKGYADQHQVVFQLAEVAPDISVRVDEQRFLQVMANLLSNAAKFSPPDRTVDIQVEFVKKDWVRIAVIDYGSGIPLEFQHRLFEKFSQADASDSRKKGGTGLGLAITKELLENMNGHISVESQPGAGSRFYIDLPCQF